VIDERRRAVEQHRGPKEANRESQFGQQPTQRAVEFETPTTSALFHHPDQHVLDGKRRSLTSHDGHIGKRDGLMVGPYESRQCVSVTHGRPIDTQSGQVRFDETTSVVTHDRDRIIGSVGTMAAMSHLTTVRVAGATQAGRVDGDDIVLLDAADVGAVLRAGGATETGQRLPWEGADLAPLVTHPGKIVCVGVNYLDHIAEMGRERPDYPTYFGKYREALIGAYDDMILPDPMVSTQVDWEAELAIVIGSTARNVRGDAALAAVAGYTVFNDGTVRDWQRRTTQFLAGKTFEGLSPLGPVLVGTDELGDGRGLEIRCEVDGDTKQQSSTSELCFTVTDIVADLSTILTLEPGDVIATGTPSGVGAARTPPEWLTDGSVVRCSIEGIGATENRCRLPHQRQS